jgi:hypothetical protein
MWMSGMPHAYNAFGIDSVMPQTLPPDTMDQLFADSHLFLCETFGGRHYFVGNSVSVEAAQFSPNSSDNCGRVLQNIVKSSIGFTGKNDRFPYEYRTAAFAPMQITVQDYPGFSRLNPRMFCSVQDSAFSGLFQTAVVPLPVSIPPSGSPLVIQQNNYSMVNCLTDTIQLQNVGTDSSLYASDQHTNLVFQMDLVTDSCQTDTTSVPCQFYPGAVQ